MNSELTLIKIHNPFSRDDRDIVPVAYEHGRTLLDIRNEHFPLMPVTVSVNGRVVPQEELAVTFPIAGDQIVFVPVIQGGDGGILRSVLMIVVAAVATYFFGPAGTSSIAGTFWGTVAMGATLIVGGMLVNALLPPPKPELPTLDSLDNSQTYSWNPQTTQRQGIAIPKFYGLNKLHGNVIGAYLEGDGQKNIINALIGLGVGPMKRLYDFKINDQYVETFTGVELYEARGALDQAALLPFQKTKLEYPLWVKVVKPTPYTYTTIGSGFDTLEVEVSFPSGIWRMDVNGNPWGSSVSFSVAIRKQGTTNWTYLTKTANWMTQVAAGHWSLGRWIDFWPLAVLGDQQPMQTRWCEYSAGSADPYAHKEGDRERLGDSVEYFAWHWVNAGELIVTSEFAGDFMTIASGQVNKPIKRTLSIDRLDLDTYEIKIENLSDDKTGVYYGDDLYLSAVREVVSDPFAYPRLAHVALKALATDQLSGSIRFSCMAECSYVRYWNGSAWVYDASDNPAWCAWDVLTQPVIQTKASTSLEPGYEYFNAAVGLSFKVARYDGKDPSKLDRNAWKDWADFCDELVPDGNGGTEKRITFNGGFDTTTSTWEAAQQIAQLGRAIIIPTGDGYTVAVDKPGTPVQMFTVGNIGLDSFKETFLRKADRASSLTMDFIDRDSGYERNTFTVMLPDIPGTNSASIPLVGCTKRSEAWRHGIYRLYNNLYISRAAEITVGIDAIACMKGDLVNIQHDVPQWGFGGRLAAANTNSVTLDQQVTIEAGKSYTIMLRLMDDTIVTRSVTNTPGAYAVLTVSSPFSSVPAQYDPYAFGETGKVVKPFRVLNIRKTQDQECTLSLIEYNESIYGADAAQPVLPTPNYSSLDALPAVTNIILDELVISRQDGTLDDVIDVYFTRPENAYYRHAEIWYSTGSGWTYSGSTVADRFRIPGVQMGLTYTVAVVTVNTLNDRAKIQNAPQAQITTLGKTAPPSDVTGFSAVQNKQFVNFSWNHIEDGDLWGYEIRQGSAWEGARVIASGVSADQYSWQAELNGTYRFLIKAIDTSGIYSVTDASVDLTLKEIDENINVVLSEDEITKPGGPDGTKTNFVFIDDATDYLTMPHMLLDTEASSWTDTTPAITGYTGGITLSAEYVTNAIDTLKIGPTWTRILDTFDAFDRGATDQSYPDRTDQSYPFDTDTHITMPVTKKTYVQFSSNGTDWSAWQEYLGTVQEEFRYAKVKYAVAVSSATGVFKLLNLLMKFDVPDVELTIAGFSVSSGTGNDISFSTYNTQFYSTPVVTATVIGGTVNKVPVISNKSTTGFHIDLRDKTDAAVAGTVDIRVSGY